MAALLILAVFAVGILCTLLFGASSYRKLTRQSDAVFQSRTAAQYLTNRVRQAPDPDGIAVTQFGGIPALVIPQQIQEQTYLTRVYCYDGWLMELFGKAETEFLPEDGEKILPVSALELQRDRGLLSILLTDAQGNTQRILLDLPGEEETT